MTFPNVPAPAPADRSTKPTPVPRVPRSPLRPIRDPYRLVVGADSPLTTRIFADTAGLRDRLERDRR